MLFPSSFLSFLFFILGVIILQSGTAQIVKVLVKVQISVQSNKIIQNAAG